MFSETMIKKTTDKKEYINHTNAARNNLKHKKDEQMTFDFKIEVRNMLKRALENYRDLYGTHHVSYEKFIQSL